jgi:hypothetical protein
MPTNKIMNNSERSYFFKYGIIQNDLENCMLWQKTRKQRREEWEGREGGGREKRM